MCKGIYEYLSVKDLSRLSLSTSVTIPQSSCRPSELDIEMPIPSNITHLLNDDKIVQSSRKYYS